MYRCEILLCTVNEITQWGFNLPTLSYYHTSPKVLLALVQYCLNVVRLLSEIS